MKTRYCNNCGDKFEAKNSRVRFCRQQKTKNCPICGRTITYTCDSDIPVTCSRSCAAKIKPKVQHRTCKLCGEEFIPTNGNQFYCRREKTKNCPICGKEFTTICTKSNVPQTCGDSKCQTLATQKGRNQFYLKSKKHCILCGEEFTPVNNTQKTCNKEFHIKKCLICGEDFEQATHKILEGTYSSTCSKECEHELRSKNNGMKNPFTVIKCFNTYNEHNPEYDHPMRNPEVRKKWVDTYKQKTGYSHPSHNPESRSRSAKSRKVSKLEQRICNLLDNYKIEYVHQYMISDGEHSHMFDYYIPKYKILMDADGVYFHSYLSDPDGKFVGDNYDEVRMSLIPKDHIFILAVEGYEEQHVKELYNILKSIDEGIYNHDTELFNWCRDVGFPYPQYSNIRMTKDWNSLKKYNKKTYEHNCRLGNSIIQNFHRSIYDCRVGTGSISNIEAWEDDELLKKVIANRLVYKNTVDPSKVLAGFNISKVCPRVSLFNPVLARYITRTYLDEYDTVFDPFSGFSGRLLGVESCGKHYIGQDLNSKVVEESIQIKNFLGLNSELSVKDILESSGTYPCLLTCPPYSDKEIYNNETVFKSCDEWIDEVLDRFICNTYIFVVDETQKYTSDIVETIQNSSHFSKAKEYVIKIHR